MRRTRRRQRQQRGGSLPFLIPLSCHGQGSGGRGGEQRDGVWGQERNGDGHAQQTRGNNLPRAIGGQQVQGLA